MRFSVITPSFRSIEWIKLCIASVADQGVEQEHIIQDSCSDDGTAKLLVNERRVKAFIEKDAGMYDAVNRGLKRAQGDICAYLNCDEQYLPSTLQRVLEYFEVQPKLDVLFADAIVVNPSGGYMCHRPSAVPSLYHSWVSGNLSALTCATFFRRRILADGDLFFNPGLKFAGDADWFVRLIKKKLTMSRLNLFTSVFAETGINLSLDERAQSEGKAFAATAPIWAQKLRLCFIWEYRLRKLMSGDYKRKPFHYSIYTKDSPGQRVSFVVPKPATRFRR